ncbi:MAG: phosphate/phosphite/phosphonate ABC transporter substrate-binding protein [Alphaproteobacteria bacterium]|nr:phosphate/phosphite/phosphonate ABC transporter substrate-binding protein [Alphaproteobacteria bacterium]
MRTIFKQALLGVVLILTKFSVVLAQDKEPLQFFVSPERSAAALAEDWIPIIRKISENSGLKINFATTADAKSYHQKFVDGAMDIAFVDPYSFASLRGDNYVAIAKPITAAEQVDDGAEKAQGIVIVHKNSPYTSIDQLHGRSMSFPGKEAFSASILPRFHMRAVGLDYEVNYIPSAVSASLAVQFGLVDAAGMESRIFASLDEKLRKNLRVIWTSLPSALCEGMKNHPFVFAINSKLPSDVRERILQALLNLNANTNAEVNLQALGFTEIAVAQTGEWSAISKLAQRVLTE